MKLLKITSALMSLAMCMSMVMTPVRVFADEAIECKASTVNPTEVGYVGIAKDTILVYRVTNNKTDGTGTVSVEGFIGFTSLIDLEDPDKNYYETVIIPATVTLLDDVTYKVTAVSANAFRKNTKIENLVIGPNVTAIGSNAFYGCSNLKKVSGGQNLKSIGASAFAYCPNLSAFVITSKVLYKIGKGAFYSDKSLFTLCIRNTTKLKKSGVKGCLKGSSVKTVRVKKSKVKKYRKIFKKKNSGRKVKVKK